jgi:SAM-dependent methyltransferase
MAVSLGDPAGPGRDRRRSDGIGGRRAVAVNRVGCMTNSDAGATYRSRLGRAGFETGSDVYERARPGYPTEAVDHLAATIGLAPGRRLVDLAAGTGKLTRQMHPYGVACIALEPSPSMREVFAQVVPGVPVVGATAERIPLATATVDAVVVAQAFHWFDAPVALAEVARILRPGGWLALIWNERDETDPMVDELVRISKWDTSAPYPVGMDFGPVVDRSGTFGPVERTKFPFVQRMELATFVDQVASRSYVQVLPEEERRNLLEQVGSFGAALPQPIAMPYVTDLFGAQVAS